MCEPCELVSPCYLTTPRANQEEAHTAALLEQSRYSDNGNGTTPSPVAEVDLSFNITIYSIITATIFVFGLVNAMWMFHVMVSASKHLHNKMFEAIVRCPVAFFDTNPVGESRAMPHVGHVGLFVYVCQLAGIYRQPNNIIA